MTSARIIRSTLCAASSHKRLQASPDRKDRSDCGYALLRSSCRGPFRRRCFRFCRSGFLRRCWRHLIARRRIRCGSCRRCCRRFRRGHSRRRGCVCYSVTLILSDVVPWFHGCDPISAPGSSTITIAATCASGWGEREGIKLQRFIPTNTPTWYEKYRVLYYIGKKQLQVLILK